MTNGKLFAEYGEDSGQIKDAISLSDFPTPEDLRLRYYFQDAAIRAALEKIAVGKKKLLLSLATGISMPTRS